MQTQPRFYHASGHGTSPSSGRAAVDSNISVSNVHLSASAVRSTPEMTAGIPAGSTAATINIPQTIPEARISEDANRLFAPQPRPAPTFPCQILYDTRSMPSGVGHARSCRTRTRDFPVPNIGSSAATYTVAPTVPTSWSLRSRPNQSAQSEIPRESVRNSVPVPIPTAHGGAAGASGYPVELILRAGTATVPVGDLAAVEPTEAVSLAAIGETQVVARLEAMVQWRWPRRKRSSTS